MKNSLGLNPGIDKKNTALAEHRTLVVGATTFVGKHGLQSLLSNGAQVSVAVRNVLQEHEIQNALPFLGSESSGSNQIFVRHFSESERSWRDVLRGHESTIIYFGPESIMSAMSLRKMSADEEKLTSAFKALGESLVVRCVLVLHSHESLIEDSKLEPTSAMSRHIPGPTLWASIQRLASRNHALSELAQNLAAKYAPQIQLRVVVPSFVVGVPLDFRFGTSLRLVEYLIENKLDRAPDISISLIDVTDLARLTTDLLAMNAPRGNEREIVASTHTIYFSQLMSDIREALSVSSRVKQAPSALINMLGVVNSDFKQIAVSLGKHAPNNSAVVKKTLDGKMVPAKESIRGAVDFLVSK